MEEEDGGKELLRTGDNLQRESYPPDPWRGNMSGGIIVERAAPERLGPVPAILSRLARATPSEQIRG